MSLVQKTSMHFHVHIYCRINGLLGKLYFSDHNQESHLKDYGSIYRISNNLGVFPTVEVMEIQVLKVQLTNRDNLPLFWGDHINESH